MNGAGRFRVPAEHRPRIESLRVEGKKIAKLFQLGDERRAVETALAAEIVRDHGAVHSGGFADLPDAYAVVAVPGEKFCRRPEQLFFFSLSIPASHLIN